LLTGELGMVTVQMIGPAGVLDGFNSAARTLEKVREAQHTCLRTDAATDVFARLATPVAALVSRCLVIPSAAKCPVSVVEGVGWLQQAMGPTEHVLCCCCCCVLQILGQQVQQIGKLRILSGPAGQGVAVDLPSRVAAAVLAAKDAAAALDITVSKPTSLPLDARELMMGGRRGPPSGNRFGGGGRGGGNFRGQRGGGRGGGGGWDNDRRGGWDNNRSGGRGGGGGWDNNRSGGRRDAWGSNDGSRGRGGGGGWSDREDGGGGRGGGRGGGGRGGGGGGRGIW
jgi:hypothetical protein